MLKNKENNQAEELSRCLDILNDGRHPVVVDKEIKELTEVAVLVKQSYSQEDLPNVLIDKMVDNLATDLGKQKQKRRIHWLYGGLAGTVAAVFIAAFVQFLLPQAADNGIAQQIDNIEKQPIVAAADQSSDSIMEKATKGMVSQQGQAGNSIQAPVPEPAKEKTADPKVIAEGVHGTESSPIDQKSNQAARLQPETSNDMTTRKSIAMAKTGNQSLQETPTMQPEHKIAMMLVMPNQAAQSMKVDNTSGVIRQVYHLGNNDEIIITQKLHDENKAKIRNGVKQGEMQALADNTAQQPVTQKTTAALNRLTVTIDKYDITIEGEKTMEELQKIAESLTAKEIK
jgi:hypothetical protein